MAAALAGVAVAALSAAGLGPPRAGAGVTDGHGTRGKVAGLGVSRPGEPLDRVLADLPRMRRAGINTVTFDAWWNVDSLESIEIHPGTGQNGDTDITEDDAALQAAMSRARDSGMQVLLEPKVWCPRCERTWRGLLRPTDRNAFFQSYRGMINHYAALATRAGATGLFIGSQMTSLQDEAAQWREVAGQARTHFAGSLAYQVNWDVLDGVTFWDAVDMVSVSAYFPLSDAERPSVEDLKAAWRSSSASAFAGQQWLAKLANLAATTNKGILFGQAGYLSSTYAARQPHDPSQQHTPEPQLQADAYQALLETFEDQAWWLGVVWWEWWAVPDPLTSMTNTPRDKPAERLLTRWYAENWRPGQPEPAPAVAPGVQPGSAGSPGSGGEFGSGTGGTPYGAPFGSAPGGSSTAPPPPAPSTGDSRPVTSGANPAPGAPAPPPTPFGQPVPATTPPLAEGGAPPDGGFARFTTPPVGNGRVIAQPEPDDDGEGQRRVLVLAGLAMLVPALGGGVSMMLRRRRLAASAMAAGALGAGLAMGAENRGRWAHRRGAERRASARAPRGPRREASIFEVLRARWRASAPHRRPPMRLSLRRPRRW